MPGAANAGSGAAAAASAADAAADACSGAALADAEIAPSAMAPRRPLRSLQADVGARVLGVG